MYAATLCCISPHAFLASCCVVLAKYGVIIEPPPTKWDFFSYLLSSSMIVQCPSEEPRQQILEHELESLRKEQSDYYTKPLDHALVLDTFDATLRRSEEKQRQMVELMNPQLLDKVLQAVRGMQEEFPHLREEIQLFQDFAMHRDWKERYVHPPAQWGSTAVVLSLKREPCSGYLLPARGLFLCLCVCGFLYLSGNSSAWWQKMSNCNTTSPPSNKRLPVTG